MRKLSLLIVLVLFFSQGSFADCASNLFDANKKYEAGLLQEVVSLIKPCIDDGSFSKEELVMASRLLSLTYLSLEDETNADIYIKLLLTTDPEYYFESHADPKRLKDHIDRYDVREQWNIGLNVSGNISNVVITEPIGLENTSSTLESGFGIGAGLMIEYSHSPVMSFVFSPSLISLNYHHNIGSIASRQLEFNENINALTFDLLAKRYFQLGNSTFSVGVGAQGMGLLHSYGYANTFNPENGEKVLYSTEKTEIRKGFQIGFTGSLGYTRAAGVGHFKAALQYAFYPGNFVDSDSRYRDAAFISSSNYIDPDISLRFIQLKLGYSYPLRYLVTHR